MSVPVIVLTVGVYSFGFRLLHSKHYIIIENKQRKAWMYHAKLVHCFRSALGMNPPEGMSLLLLLH